MNIMKKTYRTLAAALMVSAVLAGCQREVELTKVEKGLPVSISFNVEVPKMDEVVNTRATDEQETKIEKMAILFYDADRANSKPVVVKVNDLGAPTLENTTTNWLYKINLDEEQLDGVYSGTWYMYPIANYDKYTVVDLNNLAGKTLAEFKEYTITASGRNITSTSVMMSGRYGTDDNTTITLKPGENTFDNVFHLKRIVSKSIFKFKNGSGVTFAPQKYSIYNYSTSSTLLERNALDEYAGAGSFMEFKDLPINEKDAENLPTFFFYMPENVQKAANKEGSWAYTDREKRVADDYNTFANAPANATYVVVEGTYSGPGKTGDEGTVTGTVKYTIHLGNFDTREDKGGSFDNFSVKRNTKYTYTVTVNGVNSIIVEATTNVEGQPGAEGYIIKPSPHVVVNLDSHYENVLLSFSKTNIEKCIVSGTVPAGEGKMTSFTVKEGSTDSHLKDIAWVKFGKPASETTFANYPGDANLVNIYDLIEEIKFGTATHCIISGDNVYTQAYVDEYFYNDKPYKDFVNTEDRILSFTIGNANISQDGQSTYVEGNGFTLKQKSIKTFYNDNAGNPFGLETVEETPDNTFSESTDYQDLGTNAQNGLTNTRAIVQNASSQNWTDFVNITNNGFTGSTAPTASEIMTAKGANPLYQCLSRNRDLNGNGTIDQDEIKWYVPTYRQYIYLWCGMKSIPPDITFEHENYVTSMKGGYRIWWAYEGTAIGSAEGGAAKVRCVRNLTDRTDDVSAISSTNDNYTVTITCLKDEALRTNTQEGEYPEHMHSDPSSTLPRAFTIAKNDLTADVDVTIAASTNYGTNAGQISNLVDGNEDTYWQSNDYQRRGRFVLLTFSAPVKVTSVRVLSKQSTQSPQNQTLQISSDGTTWTDIGTVNTTDVTVTTNLDKSVKYVRLYYNNWYTSSSQLYLNEINVNYTTMKNTFTFDEIASGDSCERYYTEKTDKSDLGKWRIPNEKELYFIQLYRGEEITPNLSNGGSTGSFYAAKTKFDRNQYGQDIHMIYYIMKDNTSGNPIITTGHGQKDSEFRIRCVRDADPVTKSYDSSYGSGGTGFGL